MWHIESRGNITTTYDWKVNAGASSVVKRKAIAPHAGSPPYFQCNISIPVLPAGRQRLYFLPDRILVWDTNGVGAVGFDQLDVSSGEQRFIEDGGVPSDARVVDKTWKYVNKKGGPDRRFNDNREIPIVLYEAILLASKTGLQELFQASRTGIGSTLNSAVKQMASAISQRAEPKTEDGYIKCPCNNCDIFIESLHMVWGRPSPVHTAEWRRSCSSPPQPWIKPPSRRPVITAATQLRRTTFCCICDKRLHEPNRCIGSFHSRTHTPWEHEPSTSCNSGREPALIFARKSMSGLTSAATRFMGSRRSNSDYFAVAAGGVCLMNLLAHARKYFIFDRSSWPPLCCRQASSPSSRPVLTGGIFTVR